VARGEETEGYGESRGELRMILVNAVSSRPTLSSIETVNNKTNSDDTQMGREAKNQNIRR